MKFYWFLTFILIFAAGCISSGKGAVYNTESEQAVAMQTYRRQEEKELAKLQKEQVAATKAETSAPQPSESAAAAKPIPNPEPERRPVADSPTAQPPNTITPEEALKSALKELPGDKRLMFSLYDFATGQNLEHNGNRVVFPASLIKTLYMTAFLEDVQAGGHSLDSIYTLQQRDKYAGQTIVGGMGLLQHEPSGTEVTYGELLALMMAESDNVATNIITNTLGFGHINNRIKAYGLKQTRAHRQMFDHDSNLPDNLTTMNDLVRLLVLIEEQQFFSGELYDAGIDAMRQASKCRIGRYASSEVQVANKLGNTSTILADMALIHFPDREPIALAILIQGKERHQVDEKANAELMGRLAEQIINYYLYN